MRLVYSCTNLLIIVGEPVRLVFELHVEFFETVEFLFELLKVIHRSLEFVAYLFEPVSESFAVGSDVVSLVEYRCKYRRGRVTRVRSA